MAISAVTVRVNSGAAAASFTSAAFTPSNDALLIAWCSARTSAAAIPSVSDSLGGTWTLVPGTNVSAGAGAMKSALYYSRQPSSPSSMTVTVSSTGAISTALLVADYTGSSTDTSNVGVSTNGAGDPAPTLPLGAGASTSTGLVFGNFNAGANPTVSPTAVGYSQVVLSVPTTNLRHALYTDAGSPAANPTFTSTATDSSAVVWELKEAGAGPSPITGTIAQTINEASQSADGTYTDPAPGAITGTAAQTAPRVTQALSGTRTVPAITGAIAQVKSPATQALSGTVAGPGAITGTIIQTKARATQTLAGTFTAPARTGTIAQTKARATQALSGTFTGEITAITGTIVQTAPHAVQALNGAATGLEPDRRQGGGFANWSPALDKKRRRAWEEVEEARQELRRTITAILAGEPQVDKAEESAARAEALEAVSALGQARRELGGVSELADFRAEIQHVERAVLRAIAGGRPKRNLMQDIDRLGMAQGRAAEMFRFEEEAIVALLA